MINTWGVFIVCKQGCVWNESPGWIHLIPELFPSIYLWFSHLLTVYKVSAWPEMRLVDRGHIPASRSWPKWWFAVYTQQGEKVGRVLAFTFSQGNWHLTCLSFTLAPRHPLKSTLSVLEFLWSPPFLLSVWQSKVDFTLITAVIATWRLTIWPKLFREANS